MRDTVDNTPSMAGDRRSERRLLGLFAGTCGLLIAVGFAVPLLLGEARTAAVSLGEVSEALLVEIRDHRGEAVLSGEFRTRVDVLGNIEKDAALHDSAGRTVIGEVEVEIPAAGREHRRPELEVDIMGLPPRQTFSVVIDDRTVGTFVTDDRGSVDMELQEGEVQSRTER